jgi:hypothetical protein
MTKDTKDGLKTLKDIDWYWIGDEEDIAPLDKGVILTELRAEALNWCDALNHGKKTHTYAGEEISCDEAYIARQILLEIFNLDEDLK